MSHRAMDRNPSEMRSRWQRIPSTSGRSRFSLPPICILQYSPRQIDFIKSGNAKKLRVRGILVKHNLMASMETAILTARVSRFFGQLPQRSFSASE